MNNGQLNNGGSDVNNDDSANELDYAIRRGRFWLRRTHEVAKAMANGVAPPPLADRPPRRMNNGPRPVKIEFTAAAGICDRVQLSAATLDDLKRGDWISEAPAPSGQRDRDQPRVNNGAARPTVTFNDGGSLEQAAAAIDRVRGACGHVADRAGGPPCDMARTPAQAQAHEHGDRVSLAPAANGQDEAAGACFGQSGELPPPTGGSSVQRPPIRVELTGPPAADLAEDQRGRRIPILLPDALRKVADSYGISLADLADVIAAIYRAKQSQAPTAAAVLAAWEAVSGQRLTVSDLQFAAATAVRQQPPAPPAPSPRPAPPPSPPPPPPPLARDAEDRLEAHRRDYQARKG